jgi:hypothetical protein
MTADDAKALRWAVRKLSTKFRSRLHATSCREYDPDAYTKWGAAIWCSCGASKRLQRATDAAKRLK